MYAKAMGYRVIACLYPYFPQAPSLVTRMNSIFNNKTRADDIADDKLAQATDCGADIVVNLTQTDIASCEKAPSTIVISGAIAAYDNAITLTANHGTIVTVGLPPTSWPAPSKFSFHIPTAIPVIAL